MHRLKYFKSFNHKSSIFNVPYRGFTIIEVLLSLALLTIILGTIYSSFFTVQRALERFDVISLKYHEIRTALDLMRREIEGALHDNSPGQTSDNTQAAFIMEDRDILGKPISRLHFSAFSFLGSGLKSISYYVEKRDKSLVLLKTEAPPFLLQTERPLSDTLMVKGVSTEMIDAIEGFTVETLFKEKWIKTWDTRETGTLPDIVRISIEFDDGGKTVKLTEYAIPKVGRQL
jgi:prepilin-type N-terminal cleavage/methylation domain-containing protein